MVRRRTPGGLGIMRPLRRSRAPSRGAYLRPTSKQMLAHPFVRDANTSCLAALVREKRERAGEVAIGGRVVVFLPTNGADATGLSEATFVGLSKSYVAFAIEGGKFAKGTPRLLPSARLGKVLPTVRAAPRRPFRPWRRVPRQRRCGPFRGAL